MTSASTTSFLEKLHFPGSLMKITCDLYQLFVSAQGAARPKIGVDGTSRNLAIDNCLYLTNSFNDGHTWLDDDFAKRIRWALLTGGLSIR